MEDKKEIQLLDLIKYVLMHSIAQGFLIFSGALVVISIWKGNDYVFLSFFTLFYSIINFKIEAIRRHPSMGNYGMRTTIGSILYTLISWSLLIWWIIGSLLILNINLELLLNYENWYFYVSLGCLILILSWIIHIFYEKNGNKNLAVSAEQAEQYKDDYYKVTCVCNNCDLDKELYIKKGVRIDDATCSDCGVIQQLKRKKK